MAVAIYFSNPNKITYEQYEQINARLKAAGAMHPPGRMHHSVFGPPDHLMIYDIWRSREDFAKFGETLGPIMQSMGLDGGTPDIMEVKNIINPPAPRPKAAAKKRSAPKKKAKKKSAARRKAKR